MFIKNIKICGLFDLKDTKEHNFKYKDDKDTDDNYINSINDIRIIQGLMLIFDLKYDSKFDYKNIINKDFKGESFVEITLHQKEGDKFSHYDWLVRNELKLKRVFQNPKGIFINKKRCELSIFHHALNSLGFQNVNNLSIHKLMDEDITKVSKFVGDDFWNMLIKMIEHEEIIEMVERREGIVKQKAMTRSYEIVADTVLREIPKKVQLRNDIYERIQLNKSFFSLLYIINERKIDFFNTQKDFVDQKVQDIKQEINVSVSDEHKKERECFANFNQVLTSENILKILQAMHHELNCFAENYKGEAREQLIFNFLQGFAKFTTSSVGEHLDDDFDPNKFVDNEIASAKLSLVESIKHGKFDETKEILKALNEFDQKFINFMESDQAFPLYDHINKVDCSVKGDLISEFEHWRISEEMSIAESAKTSSTAENYLSQINKYLVDLKIPNEQFETLLKIEKLVDSLDEIKDEYLGPVFNFLDTTSGLDVKMWNDISSVAYTILFKTSLGKLYFMKKFFESDMAHAEFTFCSVEDYPIKEFDENIHESESFISMKNLIKKNLSYKQLESVILSMLYPYLLADETDYDDLEVDELGAFCIKVYDNISSISHHDGAAIVNSEWNNIWEQSEKGPVQVAQDYYQLIKEYVKVDDKIKNKFKSTEKFEDIKFTAFDERINKISQSSTIKNEKNDPMVNARKDVLNKMNQVMQASQEECKKWNQNELKEQGNLTAMASAYEQYNHIDSIVMDNNILVEFNNFKLAETFSKSEGAHIRNRTDKIQKMKQTERFQQLLEKIDIFEALRIDKAKALEDLQDNADIYIKDISEDHEQMRDFGTLYAEKVVIEDMISFLNQCIKDILNYSTVSFKQSIYDEFQNQDLEVIVNEISDVYTRLLRLKAVNRMDLKCLNPAAYQNLIDSLGKVKEFSNKDLYNPMKIRKRAYPLMNVVVVKVLKDTVHNFTLTYNSVLSNYISNSNLFFYTKSEMNEVDDTNFTWRYFDISKLKSIDFVEKWKDEKRTLPLACRQLIKALLLILHIINYLSVFKFIVISEKLFEGMDKDLINELRKFLRSISKYVQIILYEESGDEESIQPMEVDYLEE
ncbi:uncharacterized protein [Chironomus tepperi]|uniref:uncharacterized protein n=1 Tax=Chironomus tepperi TaxID=113505 RepID=UPI00391F7136